jgi:hypothetical protein
MRLLFFLLALVSQAIGDVVFNPALLDYMEKNMPQRGVIKTTRTFVFVDVDDDYIHKLITFIQEEGFQEPPYFGNPYDEGAHISIIYNDEKAEFGVGDIDECGQVVHFIPKACHIVYPVQWKAVDAVYCLEVEVPELDRIREKYGLPPKKYPFHITIGVKYKTPQAA